MFQRVNVLVDNIAKPDQPIKIANSSIYGLNGFEITRRLSVQEIDELLAMYNTAHASKVFRLKNSGDKYKVTHVSILNEEGKAVIAINYVPVVQIEDTVKAAYTNRHTRPASEFFDGRFELIDQATQASEYVK